MFWASVWFTFRFGMAVPGEHGHFGRRGKSAAVEERRGEHGAADGGGFPQELASCRGKCRIIFGHGIPLSLLFGESYWSLVYLKN